MRVSTATTRRGGHVEPTTCECGRPAVYKRAQECEACYIRRRRRERPELKLQRAEYDRQRWLARRTPCASCGALCDEDTTVCADCWSARSRERRQTIARMWSDGTSVQDIATALNSTVTSVAKEMNRMRREGYDLP
jgi:DNA-directed RNA polymerase specialized sigma24 family protein